MQNSTEAFENTIVGARRVFRKVRANFAHKTNGNLNRIIRRLFEQQHKNLKGDDFVRDTLVNEVCNESRG